MEKRGISGRLGSTSAIGRSGLVLVNSLLGHFVARIHASFVPHRIQCYGPIGENCGKPEESVSALGYLTMRIDAHRSLTLFKNRISIGHSSRPP